MVIKPVNLCKTIQRKLPLSNSNKHNVHPMKNVNCRRLKFVSDNIQQLNYPTIYLLTDTSPYQAMFAIQPNKLPSHLHLHVDKDGTYEAEDIKI